MTRLWFVCALATACGAPRATPTVTVEPLPRAASVEPEPVPVPRATEAKVPAAPEALAPGRVTVVHFFASWCLPCRKSLPELDALSVRHAGRVAVVGIGEDDDEPSERAFVASVHATFPIQLDADRKHAGLWRPTTMPSTFVVDRHGALRFTHAGYHDDDAETLEREVTSLDREP